MPVYFHCGSCKTEDIGVKQKIPIQDNKKDKKFLKYNNTQPGEPKTAVRSVSLGMRC